MRDSLVAQRPTANAGDTGEGDESLIPGSERFPGEENGNPLQYSCLENSMNRGAWWATVWGLGHDWKHEHIHTHIHTHSLSLSLFEWESQRKVVTDGSLERLRNKGNDLVTQLFRISAGPKWKEYYRTSRPTLQSTHSEIERRGS